MLAHSSPHYLWLVAILIFILERSKNLKIVFSRSFGYIHRIAETCLREMITIFQGYKNITEAAYCQVAIDD